MDQTVVRESTRRSHREQVGRVITAMRKQIDQPISLRSLARIGAASPYHFTRTFRRVTGIPPAQFLSALRLDLARQLLLHSSRKVIDICYDVGFNSVGSFTRRFTQAFGVAPGAFRAMSQVGVQPLSMSGEPLSDPATNGAGHTVSGHVTKPADFNGVVCVGLFSTPLPQSKPVACTIAAENGEFALGDLPAGRWFLFALGLQLPILPHQCFYQETALRGGGQVVDVSAANICGDTELFLRPALATDPPILLFLPDLTGIAAIARDRRDRA
ncbi:MAG TPA: AraC family transcriptional regulator [Candidatus Angelobacter sp.]|nr:AraC family transcriptional regulator [Candidatus Angelobacter sp.]